ncbi:TPA: hypothetical protein R4X10_005344 [Raoultella ornithinolytica]|nr:hypothetical protein [Raoultella ornithinolytica]
MTANITALAQREKFEAWFVNDVVGADVNFPAFKDGEYTEGEIYDEQLYFMLQAMWMAWKAAGAELVEALEKAQRRISRLESRSVKLPHRNLGHEKLFLLCPFPYYDAEDMEKALAAAGIKWEVE